MFKKRLEAHNTPTEVINWRLWYGVFVFGIMGAARGIDEGLIGTSAEQPSFQKLFGLNNGTKQEQADLLSNITSMVQMGSILGALIAFVITDRIGRLWATRQLCLLWVLGIMIFLLSATNGSIGMVYAGRFIAGVGIGQTTVVAPTYLAEVAPRTIRGLCVTMFSGAVYLGIMLAYFASWGSNLHISSSTNLQWVVPNLMHIYFAAIIFALSFGAVESPRWLVKVGKNEKAVENLSKLRHLPQDHWFVQSEVMDIQDQLNREREATMGTRWWGALKELVMLPANRYRIMLSIFSQLLGQWSGANSITIYAAQYFAMVGVSGQSEKLFSTVVFGIVKFASSLICALFLIDYIGRKRSLMSGITLQFVAMLYMAIYLVVFPSVGDEDAPESAAEKSAGKAAIAAIYISGFGWALGWNSIQYLINSEIYPLRLRAIGGSFAMTFHFVNQYGNTKAVPSMFISMTTGGTMFFFSTITLIGFVWVWFFLPELSGKSLEAIDAIFELPWYVIGRKGKELTMERGGLQESMGAQKAGDVDYVESVTEVERKV
ncbi:MFS quinate transporter-like protein [Polychaeton citri CBS 116435]|uniref:MFS quinate transporter-like protein n=1 Tax=Polychaeton citri CBS 116435 TaxID=1314669 RepID=A0A9P4QG91_9PEZI|nr:MFS quinate transporter-like protein [Polychaeton citri CBS 116435]